MLLARDAKDLKQKLDAREIARCLPVLEEGHKQGKAVRGFSYPLGAQRRAPHRAAVFGPTRWTNLYFPCRWLIWGDLIGGPLRDVLGRGIRDVAVSTCAWRGFLSHTRYWRPDGQNKHIAELRRALDLLDANDAGQEEIEAPQRAGATEG